MAAEIDEVEVREPTEEDEGRVVFFLTDGRSVGIPLSWSWRLQEATPEERQNYEIYPGGYGVHWPDVDEDLSARGALEGAAAPRPVEVDHEKARREAWPPGRIKRLRKRLGDTQEEFGERLGVRQGTVSDWETGKHLPRKVAVRLLDQLASSHPWYEELEEVQTEMRNPESEGSPPSESSVTELKRKSELKLHSPDTEK